MGTVHSYITTSRRSPDEYLYNGRTLRVVGVQIHVFAPDDLERPEAVASSIDDAMRWVDKYVSKK